MVIRARWLTAPAFLAVADVGHNLKAESTEWYMSTEITDRGKRTVGLTVIVLKHRKMAPDGTFVLFECEHAVLDDGLQGIEVPTVSGRASVDVKLPPGVETMVTYSLVGEPGYTGQVLLP
jgi:hypothetical protein